MLLLLYKNTSSKTNLLLCFTYSRNQKGLGGECQMKKYVGIACFSLAIALSGIGLVSAGYNLGPNNIFHMETQAGVAINGKWVEGTMSNGASDAWNYQKQVYARSGASGTYSDWAPKRQGSITHRDYGSFTDDYAEVRGNWRQ